MDSSQNDESENEKKSVFPNINLFSFSNLPSTIRERNNEIEKNLLTIYERKNMPIVRHKKTNSMNIKRTFHQRKFTVNPSKRKVSTFLGSSEEKELPNTEKIKRILLEQKKRHESELPICDDEEIKIKNNLFYLSAINQSNNQLNLKTSFSASNNLLSTQMNPKKKIKRKLSKKKNYFQTIQKDIKRLDYVNTLNLKDMKREKKRFQNIENYMQNILRAYKWKFIMTDSDKDLRPDTFFGKAGQESYGQIAFNQRLDSMINNLRDKGINFINMKNLLRKRDETNNIKLKLEKRIKDEKEKRHFIKNLLESNKIIFNGIMNDK